MRFTAYVLKSANPPQNINNSHLREAAMLSWHKQKHAVPWSTAAKIPGRRCVAVACTRAVKCWDCLWPLEQDSNDHRHLFVLWGENLRLYKHWCTWQLLMPTFWIFFLTLLLKCDRWLELLFYLQYRAYYSLWFHSRWRCLFSWSCLFLKCWYWAIWLWYFGNCSNIQHSF